jgi:hypothetical protein
LYVFIEGVKTDYRNSQILLFSTIYNILLSRLTPCMEEIIGDHQCGVSHNRSTTDQISCIHQILEKKMGVQWDKTSRKPMTQLGEKYFIFSLNLVYP